MYTYIHTYIHVHCLYILIHMCAYTDACIYIYIHMHTCMYVHTDIYMYTYMYAQRGIKANILDQMMETANIVAALFRSETLSAMGSISVRGRWPKSSRSASELPFAGFMVYKYLLRKDHSSISMHHISI